MFKVGDKVKIVKKENRQDKAKIGMHGKILSGSTDSWRVYIKEINDYYYFNDSELELLSFTKSDLKDNHIVVYKNGNKLLWEDVCMKINYTEDLIYESLDDVTINEVYEFDKLVWKREEQILDEVEKKWLRDVIRPFRDRVGYIKLNNYLCEEQVFIAINIKGESSTYFPCFKKGTMYKKMELNKEYSIKELGL